MIGLILMTAQGVCLGAEYYVATTGNDTTGNGSIGSPWQTIFRGQSELNPGDTLLIRGGRYYESVRVTGNGTLGNPITIKGYPNEKVILDGREAVTGWTQCTETDAYLTVQGTVNPNYANIYKTTIHKDDLPADMDDFMVYEDSIHSRIARYPSQPLGYGYDLSLFIALAPETNGQTAYLLDSDELTQAADYWNGAWVDVFSHGANGWVIRKTIADFYDSKIYFDEALSSALIADDNKQDTYSIVNHPHVLDSAGEFAFTKTPDGNGNYTFFLWPMDTANLIANTTIPAKSTGIATSSRDYVTLQDLTIVGYSSYGIFMDAPIGDLSIGITVHGCTVEDCGDTGIYMRRADDATIEYCTVNRVGGRGVFINTGNNGLIQHCNVIGAGSTSASLFTMKRGRILNNILHDTIGSHGNGISCYINCEKILIAYNYLPQANLALQDIKDVVVFANIVDYENLSGSVMNTWVDSHGRTNGLQVYINNTFLGDSEDDALGLPSQDEEPYPLNYVINNILDGCSSWDADLVTDMSYNLYTGYGWRQQLRYGWTLQEGEKDGRSYSLDQIFTSPGSAGSQDYTLLASSPVIGAGKSITALLETLGITGVDPWFPGFDFSKDKAGNSWAATPSMGAYEYITDGSPNLYGDVSENGAISATDASMAARYAVGLESLTASQITLADVTGNGSVSATDASWIARRAVGDTVVFPVEE
jgi:hypothetical protein